MLAALASSWLEAAAPSSATVVVEVAPLPSAVGAGGTAALVEARDDMAQRTKVPRGPPPPHPALLYCTLDMSGGDQSKEALKVLLCFIAASHV